MEQAARDNMIHIFRHPGIAGAAIMRRALNVNQIHKTLKSPKMVPLTTVVWTGCLVYGHFEARTSCELFVSRRSSPLFCSVGTVTGMMTQIRLHNNLSCKAREKENL